MNRFVLVSIVLLFTNIVSNGATVAHWDMADPGAINGSSMPGNGDRIDLDGDGSMDTDDFRISSRDISGNGNHLTAWTSNWMKWSSDSFTGDYSMVNGNSYPAAGTDSEYNPYLTGINAETITPLQWTVEALFKSTNLSSNRTIVGRDGYNINDNGSDRSALYLSTRGTDMAISFTDVTGAYHLVQVDADLETNRWYHVAGVSDGDTLYLYIDGLLLGSQDISSSSDTRLAADVDSNMDTYGWSVARGMYGSRDTRKADHVDRFFGFVDEVAISDEALDVSSFVVDFPQDQPSAPGGLSFSEGNNTVTMNWDDNSETISGYNVYRGTASGGSYSLVATGLSISAYMDASVVNKTTYYYVITAVGALGLESENSIEINATPYLPAPRKMAALDRGVIAVKTDSGIYVGWRMLGNEPETFGYNLYRDGSKLNDSPIIDSTNYLDPGGSTASTYQIAAEINGTELSLSSPVSVWDNYYKDIPLQRPAGGTVPDGGNYTYSPNDCSVGDLDGDGQLEIVVKWDPSNSKDPAQGGYSGNAILDAYEFDGTFLWRIDLGVNIRAGAHYTQFMVYDLDSDGVAEVACKTAPGTVDGTGVYVLLNNDDPAVDYRNSSGYILSGPEYLTVFSGQTGKELSTVPYNPPRGNVSDWGDGYGNRVDRFLACVAYFDGQYPSLVMTRGYYAKTVLAAWDFVNGQLVQRWVFDSTVSGNSAYGGQGCHSLSVADVDYDGRDEVIFGSCVIDDDGTGLHSTRLGHGDALHVSDMDPDRPGLEVWMPHESSASGATYRDAFTGEILIEHTNSGDVGRGVAAHIDGNYPGYQLWSYARGGTYNVDGNQMSGNMPQTGFLVWWSADLQREFLDKAGSTGSPILEKWWNDGTYRYLSIYNVGGSYRTQNINGTKANPNLCCDLFGDWREELIYRDSDNTRLRILTSTSLNTTRIYTLLHDPQYRLAIAWQNVGYNQPPHPSFYIGAGMDIPPIPNIDLTGKKSFITNKIGFNNELELEMVSGASLASYINDPAGVTFCKVSGPDWLNVESDGTLSGIPANLNVGDNVFTVLVDNGQGISDTAQMNIQVANVYSGTQGIEDLTGFVAQWLIDGCSDIPACDGASLDGDGEVNLSDFSILSKNWLCDESLQLYLNFDESDNGVIDSSIYDRLCQAVNGPSKDSAGYSGRAIRFDGVDDYIEIENYPGVSGSNPRTVAVWIKADEDLADSDKTIRTIVSWGKTEPGEKFLFMLDNITGQLALATYGGRLLGGPDLEDGQWHHVAVVLPEGANNMSLVKMYVDGQELSTNAASLDVDINTYSTENVLVGASDIDAAEGIQIPMFSFKGSMDEMGIYNAELSASEIFEAAQVISNN